MRSNYEETLDTMFPVRCFTCNKVIGNKYETFHDRVAKIESDTSRTPAEKHEDVIGVLHSMRVYSMCCKTIFLTHVEDYADQAARTGSLFRMNASDIVGTEGEIAGTVAVRMPGDGGLSRSGSAVTRRKVPTVILAR